MTQEIVKKEDFIIPVDSIFSVFENHLQIKGNSRIMFSGKFGIGKTFFLNEFFEKNKEKYDVYHLFPVNYQIASNEDIFDFLKSDILVELLKKRVVFDEKDNLDKSFVDFIKNQWNTNSFLKGTIENTVELLPFGFSKLGKPLKTALEVDKKFQEFKEKGDKTEIDNFLKKNNTESDIISEIIKKKIQDSKEERESILILDDLERIDPEHIFRILNVFSAHLDSHSKEIPNKFGFDKIILVADFSNLESIFHHRYGKDTDSDGYFDKFFSVSLFEFNNEKNILRLLDDIISRFNVDKKSFDKVIGDNGFLRIVLQKLFSRLISSPNKYKINLRKLLTPIKFRIDVFDENYLGDTRASVISNIIDISIKFFIRIFGNNQEKFLNFLEDTIQNFSSIENKNLSFATFNFFLLNRLDPTKELTESGNFYSWNTYTFSVSHDGMNISEVKKNEKIISQEFMFYKLLYEYVKEKKYLIS